MATVYVNKTKIHEPQIGKYIITNAEIKNSVWVLLKKDNKFEFKRGFNTSYVPSGNYLVENNILKLIVNKNEIYKFKIDGDKLIFEGSNVDSNLVEIGTIFKLYNRK
ncbi:hypothetical protein [Dethiothermospora halolimnae]|uniref:hypothetical protein n=1 Tax=Dethiothermospora halolimnae TaxID=3114390 RepID=UPI003CCBF997